MILKLNRFFQDLNNILGCLEIPELNHPIFTCELSWCFNIKNKSCIPDGVYEVIKHKSPRFGKCFKVLDVPERTDILIHAGNTFKNTEGCLLVGLMAGTLKEEEAVLYSKKALNLMLEILPEKFKLHIINKF